MGGSERATSRRLKKLLTLRGLSLLEFSCPAVHLYTSLPHCRCFSEFRIPAEFWPSKSATFQERTML